MTILIFRESDLLVEIPLGLQVCFNSRLLQLFQEHIRFRASPSRIISAGRPSGPG